MLALFAGTGALPGLLVAALAQEGDRPVVCYMDGFAPDLPADLERIAFRIEHLGTLLKELRARGLERVCLAGKVLRPEIDPSRIDAATAPLVAGLGAAMKLGDDGTLRALMAIFESFGFRIVAAHEIAPDLLPSAGHLAGPAPTPSQQDDAKSGKAHLDDLAPADIGQACVVREGRVLGGRLPATPPAMAELVYKATQLIFALTFIEERGYLDERHYDPFTDKLFAQVAGAHAQRVHGLVSNYAKWLADPEQFSKVVEPAYAQALGGSPAAVQRTTQLYCAMTFNDRAMVARLQ